MQQKLTIDSIMRDQESDSNRKQMKSLKEIKRFVLGGSATFTLVSKATGVGFTYKVSKINETSPHFVSLMNGPDNNSNYTYMATIFNEVNLRRTRKSKVGSEAKSWKAISWFWSKLLRNDTQAIQNLEFWHEGKCCRCGRKLTDPDSIDRGTGQICFKK